MPTMAAIVGAIVLTGVSFAISVTATSRCRARARRWPAAARRDRGAEGETAGRGRPGEADHLALALLEDVLGHLAADLGGEAGRAGRRGRRDEVVARGERLHVRDRGVVAHLEHGGAPVGADDGRGDGLDVRLAARLARHRLEHVAADRRAVGVHDDPRAGARERREALAQQVRRSLAVGAGHRVVVGQRAADRAGQREGEDGGQEPAAEEPPGTVGGAGTHPGQQRAHEDPRVGPLPVAAASTHCAAGRLESTCSRLETPPARRLHPYAPPVQVRVLGPVELVGPQGVVDLGGPKQQAVLALLVAADGRPVATDRLLDALWRDEPPAKALSSLHAYVSKLRRLVEPDRAARSVPQVLVSAPPGYALRGLDATPCSSARRRPAAPPS
jgi:hypothetical protein